MCINSKIVSTHRIRESEFLSQETIDEIVSHADEIEIEARVVSEKGVFEQKTIHIEDKAIAGPVTKNTINFTMPNRGF
jgi:hypothetical protein